MGTRDRSRGLLRSAGLLLVVALLAGCSPLFFIPEMPPYLSPTGVGATTGQFSDRVRITWSSVEAATGYRVFRSTNPDGPFELIFQGVRLSFDDRDVNLSQVYWYRVEPFSQAGTGPHSAEVSGYAGPPPPPTGVTASDAAASNRITVTWRPVSGATHYRVYRSWTRDGTYVVLDEATSVSGTSLTDTTVGAGIYYWYRVSACNAQGCSRVSEDRDYGCSDPRPPGGPS